MQDVKDKNAEQTEEKYFQVVTFKLENEEYGIDIMKVQEINRMQSFTRVPNAPDYVKGVINLRGKIIPIISLRTKFGMSEKEYDKKSRIIVVNFDNITLGFIVDSVEEVLTIPESSVDTALNISTNIHSNYIKGVAKIDERLIILLELEKLFSDEEKEKMNI